MHFPYYFTQYYCNPGEKVHWREVTKRTVETAPRNCRVLSLVMVECVLNEGGPRSSWSWNFEFWGLENLTSSNKELRVYSPFCFFSAVLVFSTVLEVCTANMRFCEKEEDLTSLFEVVGAFKVSETCGGGKIEISANFQKRRSIRFVTDIFLESWRAFLCTLYKGNPRTGLLRTFLEPDWVLRSPLRLSGPLRVRVQSRSRTRLRIAASIAFSFRACFKGDLDTIAPLSRG